MAKVIKSWAIGNYKLKKLFFSPCNSKLCQPELILLIAEVLNNKAIAEKFILNVNTVQTQRKNIIKKFGFCI
jgi:DNA-binding NarL/FixJ family response regulator